MIKRYGLGANLEGLTLGSMRPSLVQIVERKDGDYVRYEDYAAAMESIGAGGVSGRITSKSIDEHRAEFDEWVARTYVVSGGSALALHKGDYKHKLIREMWRAWKEARGIRE